MKECSKYYKNAFNKKGQTPNLTFYKLNRISIIMDKDTIIMIAEKSMPKRDRKYLEKK